MAESKQGFNWRNMNWRRPWQWLQGSGYVYKSPGSKFSGKNFSSTASKIAGGIALAYLVVVLVLGFWWSREPDMVAITELVKEQADEDDIASPVTGYATATAIIFLGDTLLERPGGYLSNDLLPPGVYLDNKPSWEFGVLVHLREITRAMRNDISRSQSQSAQDPDLSVAEGYFFFDNSSWIFPATESEYRLGIKHMRSYAKRLADPGNPDAQFYARADNLTRWLGEVERRLGDMSQRLSLSVGKEQINLGLAGERTATRATDAPAESRQKTSWFDIDDVFFEARGQTWALVHLLRAVRHDFRSVLEDKNALVSLDQIIRELEATQQSIFSPMILNGSGFGPLANHSLVMASYISRVNAALIDLRDLLDRG